MKLTGPGTSEGTSSLAAGGGAATTYVNGPAAIGGGLDYGIGTGGQESLRHSSDPARRCSINVIVTAGVAPLFEV